MSAQVAGSDQTLSVPEMEETPTRRRRCTRAEYYRMAGVGLLSPEEKTELLDEDIWKK